MKLILVRHGQTDANANKLLQGSRLDLPLNKNGLQQAKAVIPLMKDKKISTVYSSQLKRAYETAQVIADSFGLEVNTTSLLNERDFGDLTNKTWEQIHSQFGSDQLEHNNRSDSYDYRPYGGESANQVKKRVEEFISAAKERHIGQVIAVVTHSGIIRMLHHMLGIEQPPHVENSSLHEFII